MHLRIIASLSIALALWATSGAASAGVWVWGCQGKTGDQQIVFNRYALVVLPAQEKLGTLREIIDRDSIVKDGDPASTYESAGGGDFGFNPVEKFQRHGDASHTVTLTEKSSKKVSRKSRLICGRDETTDIFRKVYRYQRNDEPASDITMQCLEYQLSTRGGRKGC
jgi:hypothetical protein